jgi:hypothetical protein
MPHFLAKIHCSHWDPNGFQGGCGEVRMGSMRDKLLAAYQSGLTIREHLAKRDPANTGWQRDLSVSNVKIGDVLVAQGDGLGALAAYQAALVIAEGLAKRDPAKTQWQIDVAVSCAKLGSLDSLILIQEREEYLSRGPQSAHNTQAGRQVA